MFVCIYRVLVILIHPHSLQPPQIKLKRKINNKNKKTKRPQTSKQISKRKTKKKSKHNKIMVWNCNVMQSVIHYRSPSVHTYNESLVWFQVSGFCYTMDIVPTFGFLLSIRLLACVMEFLQPGICRYGPFTFSSSLQMRQIFGKHIALFLDLGGSWVGKFTSFSSLSPPWQAALHHSVKLTQHSFQDRMGLTARETAQAELCPLNVSNNCVTRSVCSATVCL